MVLFLRASARWQCWCITSIWQAVAALVTQMTCTQGSSPNHKLMRNCKNAPIIFCANVIIKYVRDRTCGVCTVPLALAAKPLGNISLQQPLQQIFQLCSEGVWQLHVLQGLKRGQAKGGGQRKDCLRTWQPWHLQWNVFKQVSHHILPFTSNTSPNNPWQSSQGLF